MSSPDSGKSKMTAAALHPELSRHWTKRLARAVGVPIETARFWIYHGMPRHRRREIAHVVLAECDRLEAVIADTRRRWEGVANDEATGALARGEADPAGARSRRVGEPVTRR